MKKKKRIKTWFLSITALVIVAAAAALFFIKNRPQALAAEEQPVEITPVNMSVYNGETEDMLNGQGYVENQVVAVADSKREAKKIAKAVGGELLSYENQVVVIQIGITVEEMLQRLEEDPSLPRVYPNYQNYQTFTE